MWGTKKFHIFSDIINGRCPAGQNGRWVDGRRGGESAKEAEKIGLTSERGRRPPFLGEVARHVTLIFAPTSDLFPRDLWRAAKCFRSSPSLTSQGSRNGRGSQKTLAERPRRAVQRLVLHLSYDFGALDIISDIIIAIANQFTLPTGSHAA